MGEREKSPGATMAVSSSSDLPLSHRVSLLLPLVVFFLFYSLVLSDAAVLKGVGPDHPALNVSLTLCDRIQVSGYSRTNLGKYAYSFSVTLAPLLTVRKRLHSKIQVCFHGNASLGMCQCKKAGWKNLQSGYWSSVMSPYDEKYMDVKFSGEPSGSITISVAEDFQIWRILLLVAGLVMILGAPVFSRWLPFYYTSSMAIGVFVLALAIVFQVMKLVKKNTIYLAFFGYLIGAGSFIGILTMILGQSEEMCNPVTILVLLGIVIIGAGFGFWTVKKFVVSKDGGVDTSVAQFVKWAMRIVAATFILQSTMDTPLALGAFFLAGLLAYLLSKTVHKYT